VAIFPVGLAVLVLLDGQAIPRMAAHTRRAVAFRAARSVRLQCGSAGWREGDYAVFERDGRRARVLLPGGGPQALERDDVALAAPLRDLGERVRYDPASHTLYVTTPSESRAPLERATPAPQRAVAPRSVFTPDPVATPRPVWSGPPLPRRTPLPFPPG